MRERTLVDVIAAGLSEHDREGPAYLEGIGVALAGYELKNPVGPALDRIADAIERLAEAVEGLNAGPK